MKTVAQEYVHEQELRGGKENEGTAKRCRYQYGVSGEIKKTFQPLFFFQPIAIALPSPSSIFLLLYIAPLGLRILCLCFQMVSGSSLGLWGGGIVLIVRAEDC